MTMDLKMHVPYMMTMKSCGYITPYESSLQPYTLYPLSSCTAYRQPPPLVDASHPHSMMNLHFNPEPSTTNSVMISVYLILLHLLHIFRYYKAQQS